MDGPTTMLPGSAAASNRAAVLTASPVTKRSPSSRARAVSARTSPVSMPMRSASVGPPGFVAARWAMADCISRAARTARSASSSWTLGTPKTARRASPANFSTVPSYRRTSWARRSKVEDTSDEMSSGSWRSARSVKPARSAKRSVATLRSRRPEGRTPAVASVSDAAPAAGAAVASAGAAVASAGGAARPHRLQKRASGSMGSPHTRHRDPRGDPHAGQ